MILFIRSAIKNFFPEGPSTVCLPERIIVLKKKEFRILVARVSEISILFVRFAIKYSFQKNSLLHCLPKRILFLEKRIPDSCSMSFWNWISVHEICNYTFFPEELSTSLPAEKNSRSWEKNSRFMRQEFLK